MFELLSSVALALLACGIKFRGRRELHVVLMGAAFTLDLATLITVEVTRGAIHKTVTTHSWLLFVHVAASLTVLAGYMAMLLLGLSMQAGNTDNRHWHRRVAWLFGAARLTNYATSWMI